MSMCSFVVVITLLALVAYSAGTLLVNRTTDLGNITGTISSVFGKQVFRFKGIPYAEPPLGELRFTKPQPYGRFTNGTLNAIDYGTVCAQGTGLHPVGGEDCLFLNVFAPANAKNKTVMIWIHGGGWVAGSSSSYPADVIVATQDVIVVSINYRLNIFGFMSSGDAILPGNYGMWDQRLAMQWVKDNIDDYGGNPDAITIFGESAGAFCITYHLVSPHNDRSLFQRAVSESGSVFSRHWVSRNPKQYFTNVTKGAQCDTEMDVVNCLRTKSVIQLLSTLHKDVGHWDFFPVLDGDFLPKDFGVQLSKFTRNSFSNALDVNMSSFHGFDVFSGFNNREGLLFSGIINELSEELTGRNISLGIQEKVLAAGLIDLFTESDADKVTAELMAEVVRNYYMNSPFPMDSDDRSANDRRLEVYIAVAGNIRLQLPTLAHLQLHSLLASTASTYSYIFTHSGPVGKVYDDYDLLLAGLNYSGNPAPGWLQNGAAHAAELKFVFGYVVVDDPITCMEVFGRSGCPHYPDEDKELSTQMMAHWANFAKTGNPGKDYDLFSYRGEQKYTVLKTGGLEKHTYPLNDMQRLLSAVDATIAAVDPNSLNGWKIGKDNYSPQKGSIDFITLIVIITVVAVSMFVLFALFVVKVNAIKSENGAKFNSDDFDALIKS